MLVTKKKIGVIAGGVSAEREVSLGSGRAVFNALKKRGYDVVFIDADNTLPEKLKKEEVEIAFLTLHGGWGEDGSVQGLLEVMDIPYTGSGVLASALSMNKLFSKKLFVSEGLKVAPYVLLEQGSHYRPEFPPPWVIKPLREGSSIGVSIVDREEDLEDAIQKASLYGRMVIIERFIKGKEIQIGILNDTPIGGVEVRPKRRFYDYVAKYTKGHTEYIIPPEIEETIYRKISEIALKAHRSLGCSGATRVDLILEEDTGNVFVLEVNTLPGMTETSLLPKIARHAGYEFIELLEEILKDAIQRHKEKKKKK